MARRSVLLYSSTLDLVEVGPLCTRRADNTSSSRLPRCPRETAELEGSGTREAYNKLYRLIRLVGEYVWHGGQALVLSDEGPSSTVLGMEFTSPEVVERLVLFGELYLIHYFGVPRNHQDFEPRNVLRKGWCRLTIIDFAVPNVDHTCPEWRVCSELKDVWRKLQLDRLAFRHAGEGWTYCRYIFWSFPHPCSCPSYPRPIHEW
ncbi:hypothetical protein BJV78DRAFT_633568 [Lactifluus subvellereus]|nr:hypothetical protein BJV78DRAFT_633568 [Lactifluus subvellereus]